MLKTLRCGRRSYRVLQDTVVPRRLFLSEAYRCDEAWQARLQAPLLQKIHPENFFLELEQKQNVQGKVSAVDVDMFANAIIEKYQVKELLSLLHNLRCSSETSNTLESTHHAVIKYLLNNDCTEELVYVLHDRLNYGIFPDHHCYNVLMDKYIKAKDYANAAKIAVLPMLQEDFDNPITNTLCLYSCYKHLDKPNDWPEPPAPVDDSKEEIKIRVKYLRNPFFDDHFDITNPRDLVGKTLAFYGKHMNNTLGRTCQLRGLMLYRKYDDIRNLMDQWLNNVKHNVLYEEVLDLIKKDTENFPETENSSQIENIMSNLSNFKSENFSTGNVTEVLENEVKSAIDKQADTDIAEQLKKYIEWEKLREKVLESQIQKIKVQARLENIQKIKKEIQQKEMILTFFDKEEEIELKILQLQAEEKAEMDRVLGMYNAETKLKKLEEEEEYVPPTIGKASN
ncbi:PREDICTED: 28S ribosomal protein S27, mitochondrial [Dufourea novaeangliae]|uniref:28S ribosomal protein S27, mitochondrial n=1 Tax=Dufourea novaeangliae TaxID=178035 RepID=A0A154P7V0_DUFNO|nr:PREDICTED: 28S ribosomal protein S27, mitochondrial [Dufourea novaeangliae]XP_015429573.1 PREDICTED: 28S ribosomal protein S27, mitochondrial [Dufourea novaeangliae]KZC07999.1 28S ribosomal protein S27, mitochondrial [Dufourea novaeangliae]